MAHHLAQLNVARMRGSLDEPVMAGFVAKLNEINALADGSPGFIWRLQTAEGDATALRPFPDDLILVNLSVWSSLEDLRAFAFGGPHLQVLRERRQWFARFEGTYVALWWVPVGRLPTVEEAKERLDYLHSHGDTAYAFGFKQPYPPPVTVKDARVAESTAH